MTKDEAQRSRWAFGKAVSSLIVVSLFFLAKYFFGIFLYLQIIDYFRLKIDDLRNAFDYKIISSERRSEAAATNRQLSIFNLQFLFFGSGLSGLGRSNLELYHRSKYLT